MKRITIMAALVFMASGAFAADLSVLWEYSAIEAEIVDTWVLSCGPSAEDLSGVDITIQNEIGQASYNISVPREDFSGSMYCAMKANVDGIESGYSNIAVLPVSKPFNLIIKFVE